MATETEQLVVALEARVRDFERNFRKANKTAGDQFTRIEKRAKQSGDKLESTMGAAANRMSIAMRAGLAGIFAGGVLGVGGRIAEIAGGIAQIGDEARKAGLTAKVFQEWKYVAEQARIPVDAMTDAFKELAIRADEFAVTGKGSAADAFARLGMTPEEVQQKLRNPSAFMLELIERTKALGNTAAGVRIFDELFGGTGGERLVALLQQGEGAIRDQIKAAHDLGIVIDDDLIKKSDELDRKFRAITTTVSSGLKQAILGATFALQDFIDRFREVENRQTATIQTQLSEAERNLKAAQDRRGSLGGFFNRAYDKQIEASQAEVDRLRNVLRDRALQTIRPQLETLSGGVATKGDRLGYTPPAPAKSDSTRNSAANAAQRERQAVIDLIAELEEELRLIGATDEERRAAEASRMAGAAATDEQRKRIIALNEAIHREGAALDSQQQRMQGMADATRDFIGGFRQDILSGVPPLQALGNAIGRLSDRIFDDLLTALTEVKDAGSGGGMSGIFGWLFGLFGFKGGGEISSTKHAPRVQRRANGGMIYGPGGPKDDKVPVLASNGEFMVNAAATRKHRALLEAINSGSAPALAGRGAIGKPLASNAIGGGTFIAQPSVNITIEGGASSDPQANAQLAEQAAKAARDAVHKEMADFAEKQMRNGGMFRQNGLT